MDSFHRACVVIMFVIAGYLNNEKATNECITEDGWFLSGDIGYFDEENNLFIVDRFKELIKYKGFQVCMTLTEFHF